MILRSRISDPLVSDHHGPSVSDHHDLLLRDLIIRGLGSSRSPHSRSHHSRSRISRSFAGSSFVIDHPRAHHSRSIIICGLRSSRSFALSSFALGSLGPDRALSVAFVSPLCDAVSASQLSLSSAGPHGSPRRLPPPPRQGQGEGGGGARGGVEEFAGGEAEAGSPPSTAQMPSNERRQVRIALAPSRTVASTLVSCRQAGARPATPS